jgi:hypothetical protein
MGEAGGQDTGLTGAGAGQHQQRALQRFDGGPLFRVETGKIVVHSLGNRSDTPESYMAGQQRPAVVARLGRLGPGVHHDVATRAIEQGRSVNSASPTSLFACRACFSPTAPYMRSCGAGDSLPGAFV